MPLFDPRNQDSKCSKFLNGLFTVTEEIPSAINLNIALKLLLIGTALTTTSVLAIAASPMIVLPILHYFGHRSLSKKISDDVKNRLQSMNYTFADSATSSRLTFGTFLYTHIENNSNFKIESCMQDGTLFEMEIDCLPENCETGVTFNQLPHTMRANLLIESRSACLRKADQYSINTRRMAVVFSVAAITAASSTGVGLIPVLLIAAVILSILPPLAANYGAKKSFENEQPPSPGCFSFLRGNSSPARQEPDSTNTPLLN